MNPDDNTPTTKPRRPRRRTDTTIERVTSAVLEGTANFLPTLSADDRAELRTAAYPILAASRTAAGSVQALATRMPAQGFWQGAVVSAVSALSAIASGVCLLAATAALVSSTTEDTSAKPSTPPTPAPDAPKTSVATASDAAAATDDTKGT